MNQDDNWTPHSVIYLKSKHIAFEVIVLPLDPRSAEDTATACDCDLAQVLKTLLFVDPLGPVFVVAPGDRRVSSTKLAAFTKLKRLRMARAHEVLAHTGCPIGQVSPFSSLTAQWKLLDASIFSLNRVVIGSGKPSTLISLTKEALVSAWTGQVADIVE
jgi:Cys-tRNA(Pro) deacylase